MRPKVVVFVVLCIMLMAIPYFTEAHHKAVPFSNDLPKSFSKFHALISNLLEFFEDDTLNNFFNVLNKGMGNPIKESGLLVKESKMVNETNISKSDLGIDEEDVSNRVNDRNYTTESGKNEIYNEPAFNWTFIIYLSGDNNLHVYAQNELNELLQIRKEGLAIIILYDGEIANDSCLYVITDSVYEMSRNELNMGDKNTIKDFISYAMENYPAKHYLLEIWGHGNGWVGTCLDASSGDALKLEEIKDVLENESVDVLLFSSCYMGSIEVAYSMKNCTRYLIAPEGTMLATGLPHDSFFNNFNVSMNVEETCRKIIEEYGNYYSHTSTNFAAWNMSKVSELAEAVDEFAMYLESEDSEKILEARNLSIIQGTQYIDLYDFAFNTYNQLNISIAVNIMELVNETIFAKFGDKHGIEIYFPLPSYLSKYYKNTDFAIETQWNEFISKII